ncbi:WYL domain-containing protein, partial [Streptomyces venezuelae]|uniref:WYL domain-containing protein n=1 Tax=Streptomyces venezuelae TaxID=54571 RepID=UPI003668CAFC
ARAVHVAGAWRGGLVGVRLSGGGGRPPPHATDRVVAREAMGTAGEPDASGRVTVTLPVENEDVAYTQLLSLGPEAEVLEPPGLRARFAEAAARAAALYR